MFTDAERRRIRTLVNFGEVGQAMQSTLGGPRSFKRKRVGDGEGGGQTVRARRVRIA